MTSTEIRTEFVSDSKVQLACILPAPPERVYKAWTEPEAICRWFVPGADVECRIARFEATVGGGFELIFTSPIGETSAIGTYTTLNPFDLIEFSFYGCHTTEERSSRVSVELIPEGDGTRLVLTDQRISTPEEAKGHLAGWQACLAGLAGFLSGR